MKATRSITDRIPGITNFKMDLLALAEGGLTELFLHDGTFSRGSPQRTPFETNDPEEKFLKGPPAGISPSSLLKDKFR